MIKILVLLFIHLNLYAAIYEQDDRALVYEYSETSIDHLKYSIAAKLRSKPLRISPRHYRISTKPLRQHVHNMCLKERFSHVSTFSNCTGFLVGKNLMVTAGHCLNNRDECLNSYWYFSADMNPYDKYIWAHTRDIGRCKKIISRIKNSISKNDYTLFEIEADTSGRLPLKFRTREKISDISTLKVLGHPTGLPLIITQKAIILENDSPFLFKINSNTFGGNSGSPVINERTGLVEGILTDGDRDYQLNKSLGCVETYVCTKKKCKGENVVRITNIPELVPGMTPKEPYTDLKNPRL